MELRLAPGILIWATIFAMTPAVHAATFHVTRTDDPAPGACTPGDCSLREAVIAANAAGGADQIVLAPTDHGLSLVGAGGAEAGDLDITGAVTVRGSGTPASTIQASHLLRIFDVPADATLHLDNLRLLNGKPGPAEGGNGGCLKAVNATVDITATQFDGCVATNGGAISAGNTDLSLTDSSLSNSVADAGGAVNAYVDGGAPPKQFTATNVLFLYNEASQTGGALYLFGASLRSELSGALVIGNTTGPDGSGGGMHIASGGSGEAELFLDAVTLSGNQAQDGAGLYLSDAIVEAHRVTLADNVAGNEGGGAKIFSTAGSLQFRESAAYGNSAGSTGGAFKLDFGHLEVRNATISENTASSGSALYAESDATATFLHATLVDAGPDTVRTAGTGTTVTWSNSIISGGCSQFAGGGEYVSLGGNLESFGDTCGLDQGSDLVNLMYFQLGLGPFELHGGPTRNYSIDASSEARDQGLASACPPIDQRFGVRANGSCDAGSHEYAASGGDHLFADGFDT